MGNAVHRNRARRLIREALRPLIPSILPGWDILFLARQPLAGASFQDTQEAILKLLRRSRLLVDLLDGERT